MKIFFSYQGFPHVSDSTTTKGTVCLGGQSHNPGDWEAFHLLKVFPDLLPRFGGKFPPIWGGGGCKNQRKGALGAWIPAGSNSNHPQPISIGQ